MRFRYVQLAKDIILTVMKSKCTTHVSCWKHFRPTKPHQCVIKNIPKSYKRKIDGLYFWGVALSRLILRSVTRMGISGYLPLGRRLILTFIKKNTHRTDRWHYCLIILITVNIQESFIYCLLKYIAGKGNFGRCPEEFSSNPNQAHLPITV